MAKIEVYLNRDNNIVLDLFRVSSNNPDVSLVGNQAISALNDIAKLPVVSVRDQNNNVSIAYNDFVVHFNEYMTLFSKPEMLSVVTKIKKTTEKYEVAKLKRKKVTRKNKYNKTKIVATGLALITLASITMATNIPKAEAKSATPIERQSIIQIDSTKNIEENSSVEVENTKTSTTQESKPEFKEAKESTTIDINYQDKSDSTKAYITKAYYENIISKYSNIYGIDSDLVLALATQERGIHSETKDKGGATGLMQIQNSVWKNQDITAYNYSTNRLETVNVKESKLGEIDYNIKIGCMVLQNCLDYMDYNVLASVQCYNMGYGNMKTILKAYSKECGKSVDAILNDPTDKGWMNYRYLIHEGDDNYIEHVLSWLGDDVSFDIQKRDGTDVILGVNIESSHTK